ncbi:hypothetical protein OG496_07265 [Streptomyces sp. NBC_00988]|uniref:hypothetical protein n=1 Tax=Streptomyces sp. NBC_00988 TaxID=2903704 RepID=UPI00386F18C3|nr:hypothetical protein OG496_07265 [Streptomyces sp. NBC_00988]
MADVTFSQLQPWALVPDESRVNRAEARAERDVYREHFRYKRVTRLPVDCPPWVLGQELGWVVRSPVSVEMAPLGDVDFDVPAEEELRSVGRKINRSEVWHRNNAWIATQDSGWLRLHDYRANGTWESMFLPNGMGTVEWRLGWGVHIPERYFLMVMGMAFPGLDVPMGVIASKTVNAMADRGGFSIAVHPTRPLKVGRGDPVARVVLLHADSLRSASTTIVATATTADQDSEAGH